MEYHSIRVDEHGVVTGGAAARELEYLACQLHGAIAACEQLTDGAEPVGRGRGAVNFIRPCEVDSGGSFELGAEAFRGVFVNRIGQ